MAVEYNVENEHTNFVRPKSATDAVLTPLNLVLGGRTVSITGTTQSHYRNQRTSETAVHLQPVEHTSVTTQPLPPSNAQSIKVEGVPLLSGHSVENTSVWQPNTGVCKFDFSFKNSLFNFLSFSLVPFSLNAERSVIGDFIQQFQLGL